MPGFSQWVNPVAGDIGPDLLAASPLAFSMNTAALAPYAGDPMVWTTVTGSTNRQRKLTATDITNLDADSGNVIGILGFAPADVVTGANGQWSSPIPGTNIQANVANNYNIPTMDAYAPHNPTNNATMASTLSCQNLIAGALWQNTTVVESLVGTMVGIKISTLSGYAPTFFWDSAATTKIARIVRVPLNQKLYGQTVSANVDDTTHSPRALVVVRILDAYNQYRTAFSYPD